MSTMQSISQRYSTAHATALFPPDVVRNVVVFVGDACAACIAQPRILIRTIGTSFQISCVCKIQVGVLIIQRTLVGVVAAA